MALLASRRLVSHELGPQRGTMATAAARGRGESKKRAGNARMQALTSTLRSTADRGAHTLRLTLSRLRHSSFCRSPDHTEQPKTKTKKTKFRAPPVA